MGVVIGPFDGQDWYSMGQLRLDLMFARDTLNKAIDENKRKDYKIAERHIRNKLRDYMRREVA